MRRRTDDECCACGCLCVVVWLVAVTIGLIYLIIKL